MLKRLLVVGIIALASGVSARLLTASRPAIADPSPTAGVQIPLNTPKLRWDVIWQRPAPGLVAADVASDGSTVAWVDDEGSVRRMDGVSGKTLWQTAKSHGINRIRIATNGNVVAYSLLNPARPGVRLLDGRLGDRKSVMVPVEGAIWNAVVAPSSTGEAQAFITTGKRLLYQIPLRSNVTWPGSPANLPGIAETVDVTIGSNRTPELLLGTWQDGGIGVWGGDKLPRWRRKEPDMKRNHRVALSDDGNTAVSTSGIGPQGDAALLHVWDARSGKLLWSEMLKGDDAHAAVSSDGQRIVVTFRRGEDDVQGELGAALDDKTPGRKIVLFDRSGRRLFGEKGGSFFEPELVCLSPDGNRITVRDDQNIWTLDSRGRRIGWLHLTPRIRQVVPLPDASGLLIVTGNGLMTLYKAS